MKIYNNTNGKILLCDKCGRSLGYITGDAVSFKFSFICKCRKLVLLESSAPMYNEEGAKLLCKDNSFICPSCNRILFRINKHSLVNFAFKATCRCGIVYDTYQSSNKIRRNLGRFASLDE